MNNKIEELLKEIKKEIYGEQDKNTKEAVKDAKEKFKKMLDNADNVVAIATKDGHQTTLITGIGFDTLVAYGLLTESLIKQTNKELVEATFMQSLEEVKGE